MTWLSSVSGLHVRDAASYAPAPRRGAGSCSLTSALPGAREERKPRSHRHSQEQAEGVRPGRPCSQHGAPRSPPVTGVGRFGVTLRVQGARSAVSVFAHFNWWWVGAPACRISLSSPWGRSLDFSRGRRLLGPLRSHPEAPSCLPDPFSLPLPVFYHFLLNSWRISPSQSTVHNCHLSF